MTISNNHQRGRSLMAEGGRDWDQQFAADVLESRLPSECPDIMPMTGAGRGKTKVPMGVLRIPYRPCPMTSEARPGKPNVEELSNKHNSPVTHRVGGRGRGKFLRSRETKGDREVPQEKIKSIEKGLEKARLEKKEQEWPSLLSGLLQAKHDKKKCREINDLPPASSNVIDTLHHEDDFTCPSNTIHSRDAVRLSNTFDLDKLARNKQCLSVPCGKSNSRRKRNNDITHCDYLKTLKDRNCYILVTGIPRDSSDQELLDFITSFGEVDTVKYQNDVKTESKQALIKMKKASSCDWVVSCLDGAQLSDNADPLSVVLVNDLLEQ